MSRSTRSTTIRIVTVALATTGLGVAGAGLAVAAAPQAVVTYGGNWRSRYLVEMEAAGLAPNMVLELPSPATLRDILPGTDLIATVPLRTALSFGPGLRIVDCPFPAPFEIDLYWTARTHHAPMHRWLRGLIAQVAAELEGAVIRS